MREFNYVCEGKTDTLGSGGCGCVSVCLKWRGVYLG